jgi:hypothetical protein
MTVIIILHNDPKVDEALDFIDWVPTQNRRLGNITKRDNASASQESPLDPLWSPATSRVPTLMPR